MPATVGSQYGDFAGVCEARVTEGQALPLRHRPLPVYLRSLSAELRTQAKFLFFQKNAGALLPLSGAENRFPLCPDLL